MLQSDVLLREVQQLKESILELHAEQQTKLKELETSQREIVYVMKRMSADDREKRLILNLKRSVEIDYDLHVKGNLAAWTAEYCKSCRSIRALMYEYEGENNPTLASEGEERRLLRHLNKITKRADRTVEEDEIIRRGYYKVLHRVINSLTTMDHRDEMDRVHLKRVVQYISTRLVEYWNCGVPIIKSYHRDGDIRLISSQAVFQDIWTSIRSQRYYKEKRDSRAEDSESVANGHVKSEASKSAHKPIRRVGQPKRSFSRSGASPNSISSSSTPSSQSSCSPSNHSFSTTASQQAGYLSAARNFPGRGYTTSTARRYGVLTRSANSSASSSPYANSPGSYFSCSPGVPAKTHYSARRLDTSLVHAEDCETESDADPSDQDEEESEEEEGEEENEEEDEDINEEESKECDQENQCAVQREDHSESEKEYDNNGSSMELDDVVSMHPARSEKATFKDEAEAPMTPHQMRCYQKTRGATSVDSRDSRESVAEEEAEAKMDAIFKKHLGEPSKKLRRGDLECITTPLSVAGRVAYSGSSRSGGWDAEDGNIAVESDAEHEEEANTKIEVKKSGVAAVASDSESKKSSDGEENLFDTTTASVVLEVVKEVVRNSPATTASVVSVKDNSSQSVGAMSASSRTAQLRWSMPLSRETTPRSSHKHIHIATTTPNCTIESGAAYHSAMRSSNVDNFSPLSALPASTESSKKRHKLRSEDKPEREERREHKRSKTALTSAAAPQCVAEKVEDVSRSEFGATSPRSEHSVGSSTSSASQGSVAVSISARSPLSASFQSPCMGASPESSVCTSATTPSNGLFYLDLQDEKTLKKQRRKERRERKRAEGGSGEKKKRNKHCDSMSVSSVDTASKSIDSGSRTGVHSRSALTAILGSTTSV